VLAGVAAEFERDVPYSVWVDALDAYVAAQDAALAADAALGAILPSLAGADAEPAAAEERYRAHRAMRALLERLAGERPVVVVLDDLHWADGASTELVSALVRRPPAAGVLLALGFRHGQAPAGLAAALAAPSVDRIELAGLTPEEAGALLGDRASPEILRVAGGNPFYLEQLARAGGGSPAAGAADGGVPAAVAASIAEEVAGLDPTARALLQAAAIAGEPFEPEVAAAIAELAPETTLGALDSLLARDLVRPTSVPRRFVFRHPLVRRAVYDATPGGRRLAAHARAAAFLAQRGAAVAERAHHVEQAAQQGDEEAIAVLLRAGEAAAFRAPTVAARWYEAALRLLPADDVRRQIEVRVELAGALRGLGRLEPCREVVLEALALLPPDQHSERVRLTAFVAATEHWLGWHDQAHARLMRAWEDLPDRSGAAAAALLIELAADGMYGMDSEQTLSMGRAALEAAREAGRPRLLGAALATLCLGEAATGEIAAALEHHAEAVAVLDPLTDEELSPRVEALANLAWAENYLELYDEAIAHAERGIAIGRRSGAGQLLVPMMLVKGYPLEMQGRLAEAVEVCESAVEAAQLSESSHYLFWALFELAYARYYTGELDAAIAAGEESARIGGKLKGGTMPAGGGGPGWVTAMARFLSGDAERAYGEMRALGPDDLPHKVLVERCFDWEVMALVCLERGEPDEAEGYIVRAEELAARLDLRLPTALALRGRAAVLLARGEAAAAAECALESAKTADRVGAIIVSAYSRALAGQALAAAGDRPAAVSVLRTAEAELDRCGSLRGRDQLRRELRKLGARAETRGPATGADGGIASLTRREREIADLVCDRRTNREIAAALFLSDKTIESHLRNIFVKLGVSSRVEVARAVEREPAA
jgi:ATP/maltotriose-dependent transcriptional regulator MalT